MLWIVITGGPLLRAIQCVLIERNSMSKTHREMYRPSKYWTPESPRATFRATTVGNLGINKRKKEVNEFLKGFTKQQIIEMKAAEHRKARRERQEAPREAKP
jgi:hypothetical protein